MKNCCQRNICCAKIWGLSQPSSAITVHMLREWMGEIIGGVEDLL